MTTPQFHDCKQHDMAWVALRLGHPTASRFDCIVTNAGKATKNAARERYMAELLAERLTEQLTPHFVTADMQRGTDLEPTARARYAFEFDRKVPEVGFVTCAEFPGCGCSPDGLSDGRGLEVKIPRTANLVRLLLQSDADAAYEYQLQVQGCMWLCDLPEWDLWLFSDQAGIPSRCITIQRDEAMMAAFAVHIPAFIAELSACEKRLRELGGGLGVMRDQYAELCGETK